MDALIQKFGTMLREDLLALKNGKKATRSRSDSTGSNSLSIHSLVSYGTSKTNMEADAMRRAEEVDAIRRAEEVDPLSPI